MIKRFFSNNMNSMTFVFSIVVLLNSTLAYFQVIDLGDVNKFILSVAILVVLLSLIVYILAYLNFSSEKTYHLVSFGCQFTAILLIGSFLGITPLNMSGILINFFIALGIYSLSVKKNKYELNQVALAINERLSD